MTDIKKKALELLDAVAKERGDADGWGFVNREDIRSEALCRAIEQHEAFRQEVSEFALGVKGYMASVKAMAWQSDCDEFILPKTDPLVEAVNEAWGWRGPHPDVTENLRAAIEARGGRIVWEGE